MSKMSKTTQLTTARIEELFAATLKKEGIKASVTMTQAFISIVVEAEELVEKVKSLMAQTQKATYHSVDFYAADEDMPAEWYVRFAW